MKKWTRLAGTGLVVAAVAASSTFGYDSERIDELEERIEVLEEMIGKTLLAESLSDAESEDADRPTGKAPGSNKAPSYEDLAKIDGFNVRLYDSWSGEEELGFRFDSIENTSDRTMKTVRVTMYFLNENGDPFFEKNANLLGYETLKPNYKKFMDERNYYEITNFPPTEFDPDLVRWEITKIEFE